MNWRVTLSGRFNINDLIMIVNQTFQRAIASFYLK